MKKILQLLILILVSCKFSNAQVTVSGKITDNKGLSLPGTNVMLKGTYDGSSADAEGFFQFRTNKTGLQVLVVSFIGYKTSEQEINLSETLRPVNVILEEQSGMLQEVTITAGAFETGELKRATVLKPMDIATTPSAMGDIYGALTTLPGTQIVGNEGGLYVRGGEGYETKTFIDGMQVSNPYMLTMPDLPTRSRFSPILFTGTAFSTGGYTSEYGQALSSVINLKTSGIADKTKGSFSLMSVGLSGSYTKRWERASIEGTLQYTSMKPYYALFKQQIEWKRPPDQLMGTILYRQKYGKNGMLKVIATSDHNKSALYFKSNGDSTDSSLINMNSRNYFINTVYNDLFSKKWHFKTGLAFSLDNNLTGIDANRLKESVKAINQRMTLTNYLNDQVTLKFGEEISWYSFDRDYYISDSSKTYNSGFQFRDYAIYMEPEIRFNDRFVARVGFRGEYLSLLDEWQLVPRVSMAYNTGDNSQLSLAYGLFGQRPENQYLIFNNDLRSEKATHMIINYQYEVNKRIFRLEIYRKWYQNLVKYDIENNPSPENYNNMGNGYAQGIDIFWRDSKSIRDLDYWISYSYINSERNYKNYQQLRVPSYISPHTFSVVAKYFFRRANIYSGFTYLHASPKTWYNPSLPVYSGDKTKAYNDLSLNITVIRPLLGNNCAFLLNISNLLGFENIYGYHYSSNYDHGGSYDLYPIKPQSKRFFVIAAYMLF